MLRIEGVRGSNPLSSTEFFQVRVTVTWYSAIPPTMPLYWRADGVGGGLLIGSRGSRTSTQSPRLT
jgi:hypothetical protein